LKKLLLVALSAQFILSTVLFADTPKPKYGPKETPRATPVSQSNDFFRSKKNLAPDFWSLIGFYVPQMNEYSCSAAAVAMVMNAARADLAKTADDAVITQKSMLEKVKVEEWSERLHKGGAKGEYGVTLDRLGRIVEAALKEYGFKSGSVRVVHASDTSVKTKAALVKALAQNEKSNKDFIIANFNQKAYTDDAEAGHMAPVAAYDAAKGQVLLLDPDRDYYEPYWISVDTFLAGMATLDKSANMNRGYLVVNFGQ
jgi:hypothetical protein